MFLIPTVFSSRVDILTRRVQTRTYSLPDAPPFGKSNAWPEVSLIPEAKKLLQIANVEKAPGSQLYCEIVFGQVARFFRVTVPEVQNKQCRGGSDVDWQSRSRYRIGMRDDSSCCYIGTLLLFLLLHFPE